MSNSFRDYKDTFRGSLPSGMTYDSTIARFLVNNHRFIAPWVAENYIERIIRFGFATEVPGSWDLANATLDSGATLAVGTNTPILEGIAFSTDGTKMYTVDNSGITSQKGIDEFDLSTEWDPSTASYVQHFNVYADEPAPMGVFFKSDGLKMYVIGITGQEVNEYTLSSDWDVSSASHVQAFSVATQETSPRDLFFKPDGTKMYIIGTSGDDVNEYTLSTAWDVSSATYSQNFSVAAQDTGPESLAFKSDGSKMFITGTAGDTVDEYDIETPWDISTATYSKSLSVATQGNPVALHFKPDGSRMFVGTSGESIFAFDVTSA